MTTYVVVQVTADEQRVIPEYALLGLSERAANIVAQRLTNNSGTGRVYRAVPKP
jgi:hypothetical protein